MMPARTDQHHIGRKLQRRMASLRNQAYAKFMNLDASLNHRMHRNGIKVYWWNPRFGNFGDNLTHLLLRHYGVAAIHAPPSEARMFCIGSILHVVPSEFDGLILGAGFIDDGPITPLPKAQVLCVRGPKSRARLGLKEETPLGDPGLLASRLVKGECKKKYTIGIVPHYKDSGFEGFQQLRKAYPAEVCVIDVLRPPSVVIREIAECEFIASSSLHGLVVADSFGIPNMWFSTSDSITGGAYKYEDYFSSHGQRRQPLLWNGSTTLKALITHAGASGNLVAENKERIHQVFTSVRGKMDGCNS